MLDRTWRQHLGVLGGAGREGSVGRQRQGVRRGSGVPLYSQSAREEACRRQPWGKRARSDVNSHHGRRQQTDILAQTRKLPATLTLLTKHSMTMGLEPSYSRNSFILAGSSSAVAHLRAFAPIDSASLTKSGLVMR